MPAGGNIHGRFRQFVKYNGMPAILMHYRGRAETQGSGEFEAGQIETRQIE